MKRLVSILIFLLPAALTAQQTEQLYLSGRGLGDTRTWEFYCTGGMNAEVWSTIEVPSQWELQGFGEYSYGRWYVEGKSHPPREEGFYRRTFDVPAEWDGRRISIIFEGVMTDTDVKINGRSAGPVHRGGFNGFSYDVTELIAPGRENLIEVHVKKESDNPSVNAAERKADWWIFGGIYRPVYLEAKPAVHIERIAVDARGDGILVAEVHTTPLAAGYSLEASVSHLGTPRAAYPSFSSGLEADSTTHKIVHKWGGILPWNVEDPNLYLLTLDLKDREGNLVHTHSERIGFRTVELRPRDGLYVNGTKVVLKGINRHSFHPDGGRTTNREISIMDGTLIKEMNMNAVRFHYAPDTHFLDVCDSLGIFVIDELAGWQNPYDTEVGTRLLNDLIARDVNHPSIVVWSSGNEGGFNYDLDRLYGKLDPQGRTVIHPWADWGDIDTHHYPTYQTGVARFTNGHKLFMPTEFQHGMYDQGHGAGLEDFWNKYTAHPLFVGGFMWDFSDNAVRRSDLGGILDSDGSNGADGILGPYREKEGSYYSVREIWAPIQFDKLYITPSFNGEFKVRNTYLFTNLRECHMTYRVFTAPSPLSGGEGRTVVTGEIVLPAIDPGEKGTARMTVPDAFFDGDFLEVTATDRNRNEIFTWTWPIRYVDEYTEKESSALPEDGSAELFREGDSVMLSAVGVSATFCSRDGLLKRVVNARGEVSFNNGPVPVGMNARFMEARARTEGSDAIFTAFYQGAIDSIQWRMTPSGVMGMRAVMLNKANGGKGFDDALAEYDIVNFGFSFDYPEEKMEGMRWLGRGPYRVWKNRIKGTNYGIWEKDYNDTQTGAAFESLVYPEFKGYHADLHWAVLRTGESPFTVYSETDGVFLRLYTPGEPLDNKAAKAYPDFPEGDISFLLDIPAIRCFKPIHEQGPNSQPGNIRVKLGDEGIRMNLRFDFR